MRKEITFDTFARGLIIIAGILAAYFLLDRLSDVLLPFFVAWLLAYLIYPLVTFLQYRCHLRFRIPCIVLALILFLSVFAGILAIVIPPTVREISHLRGDIVRMVNEFGESPLATQIDLYLRQNFDEKSISQIFQNEDAMSIIQMGASKIWGVLTNAFSLIKGVLGAFIILLYLFFILMDYESISDGFVNLFPRSQRGTASMILEDVKKDMNSYFRGQALIALIVGILFSIGFSIVGLPMAIGLGVFIGVLNLVPYLQMLGIVPACLLILLRSTQTGESFWLLLFYCFIVFLVVQGIQDMILTPRIMGKMMGLRPAIILLSLSVWGSLLGFIGLIIALPLTTLLISYYRFFILKERRIGDPRNAEVDWKTIEKEAEKQ
ncbi:MAG: AI-2E family transporter [Bacteroidaceae bacterium]|nr:AI-2E family transporter [Bacteroidaceae bacterium]